MARTLFQKVWDDHIVKKGENGAPDLIYVDLQLLHEVTSPIAFESLRNAGRRVRRTDLSIITEDHNTPTCDIYSPIKDDISRLQLETVRSNAKEFGMRIHSLGDPDNGVVHAFAPNLGLIHPGMTVVCGDSHTATHGAFGAIAFGIGTSEVEHVLATQTIWQSPLKNMRVEFKGKLPEGVTAKDMILKLISKIGTGGGQGYAIEFSGEAIESLSMEGRMSISNMTIEAGARVGIMRPDETTFEYIKSRPHAPQGQDWDDAMQYWSTLFSDDGAVFDKEVVIDVSTLEPFVTWGTNPGQGVSIKGSVPTREEIIAEAKAEGLNEEVQLQAWERALKYMDFTPGKRMKDVEIDTVFIGSCTNGRIEDLRAAADILRRANELGKKMQVKRMLIVPGDGRIRLQAEAEGLDKVFKEFGAQWRNAGCSMCLGMNADRIAPGERSASTSNRNFESRQGKYGRTHLVSPKIAAATAIAGHIAEPEEVL
ncbi:MAG: 3-isopropylmalate dehydratase large subunit [Candidatus Ancillula sp.]|jgi:3-isopropylmalate/(R)-2-methylmalate dehydratase large subunit|nr:3-isopropylmalate dehydratase large subunit [Candidatus Ancillula sp.]